jgi:transposase-like protein
MRPDTALPPRSSSVTESADPAVFRRRASDTGPGAPVAEPPPPAEDAPSLSPDEIQRWTARRRAALVLSILKGETTAEEIARRHALTPSEVEDWKLRFLGAAHNALRSRPRDEDALRDEQIRRLKQKVGELVIEVDTLRDALRSARANGEAEAADD